MAVVLVEEGEPVVVECLAAVKGAVVEEYLLVKKEAEFEVEEFPLVKMEEEEECQSVVMEVFGEAEYIAVAMTEVEVECPLVKMEEAGFEEAEYLVAVVLVEGECLFALIVQEEPEQVGQVEQTEKTERFAEVGQHHRFLWGSLASWV